jgi:hypothetical protein
MYGTNCFLLPMMAMTGENAGSVQLLQKVLGMLNLSFHCVMRQGNLCS